MKTAIYIIEGTAQVVLTPENEHEKNVIDLLDKDDNELSTMRGSFYHCQGGWYREGSDDKSLILRIDKKKVKTEVL